jgi:GNAT superfamily N-acetyltransferase
VPSIPPPIHDDDDVRAWFATVVVPKLDTWVIEDEASIVALVVLAPGWVEQLYVDPIRTGGGLGSRLLDLAKQLNPAGLDLWTFQANGRARRFYERHGFVPIAETDGDNEEGAPDIRYHWPRT